MSSRGGLGGHHLQMGEWIAKCGSLEEGGDLVQTFFGWLSTPGTGFEIMVLYININSIAV